MTLVENQLPVLHALRCGGYSGTARVVLATGLAEFEAESVLIDLASEGLVTREFGAWGLTSAGKAADAARITEELDSAGTRAEVTAAYERFLVLNPELLELCTAWQLRPVDGVPTVNDHDDSGYDERVLARFADLHRRAGPVLSALEAALPRFGRYRPRLAGALGRARVGELEYIADDTAAYHTVWAELHEDLLATLGIPR
ncbi:transcriptional regulator [Saccharomonospora sp. NPDC006951]